MIFDDRLEYGGKGRVEFGKLPGFVAGSTQVRFDGEGNSSIEMVVESFGALGDTRPDVSFHELLSGVMAVVGDDGRRRLRIGQESNSCRSLVVETPEGTFSVSDSLYQIGLTENFGGPEAPTTSLKFMAHSSRFDRKSAGTAVYWSVPLYNFTRPVRLIARELDQHPVRMYQRPAIPAFEDETKRVIAEFNADINNQLIPFQFDDAFAFIERVPDVKKRVERLGKREHARLITAVFSGPLRGGIPSLMEMHTAWKPLQLLPVLEFAAGQRIAAAWVDFRAEDGSLVTRVHANFGMPVFDETGHEVIREFVYSATGALLQAATASTALGEPWLRVLLHHVVELGHQHSLEEQIIHCTLAFEALNRGLDIKSSYLLLGANEDLRQQVKSLLADAARSIREIGRTGKVERSISRQIERVSQKVLNSTETERSMGESVLELLRRNGFNDAELVDAYFTSNPRADGRNSLQAVIDYFRGEVVHRAYFDFMQEAFDLGDVYQVKRHLHDILVRSVLKILGHQYGYRSPLGPLIYDREIDWVSKAGSAEELGYGGLHLL